ncbi:MAG: nitrogen fixation protein NifH [Anaerolineales bacterium]|nr:nitrogen fixation protein NifH [Anaerolineales bacterium]
MLGQDFVYADTLNWLLEPDSPGVRYLALRDLVSLSAGDPELTAAQKAAHELGSIAAILDEMDDEGYWAEPGPGYNPKYRATVWSLILLAQLGASAVVDERIDRVCAYLLNHSLTENGQFTIGGTPSTTVDCLQGNMCAALIDLGFEYPRMEKAFDWLARNVTGEGIAPNTNRQVSLRYYAGKCGPTFACGANNKLPCAWGAVKVMLALSKLPAARRTRLVERAIARGVDFLFSIDPADADYPMGWNDKPSRNWWKFGFPVFYVTDLLQNVEVFVDLGYGEDPRLTRSLAMIREKQDQQGCWALEYDYKGKTWLDFGEKKQPNKWVTLRALRVLSKVA